ncbi:restriction endonuclease subunit S [uncultured Xanthomonas sp.]|uniref:restriction endonuclease subunit S n=1 Tax=uncultured Xanthomonas sp. TaxID=152831 RepID=UPI0025D5B7C2|nr:restriction endonuclease subunit S [uncultured Xanthomonas sp.]
MSEPQIDIRPDHWAIVRDILQRHVPQYAVWAFGSRAKWTAKEFSDLDLAIITDSPLPLATSAALAEDFSESDLPWRVDIVDWAETSETFRKIIERDRVVIKEINKTPSVIEERQKIDFERLLSEPVRNGIYKAKEFHGHGVKIVNMGELFSYPRLSSVPMKRVELNESEKRRFLLEEGDLIFARRSLTAEGAGKCSIILELDEATTFESSIIRARPDKDKVHSLYLYYFFNSPAGFHSLGTIRRQVAVAGITGGDLAKLKIPVPKLKEQRAIAYVLGTLDDRIELNRRMNETLEAMARSLFKAWFVDFDGVSIEDMQESELGLIPNGWQVASLDSIADYLNGLALQKFPPESEVEFLPVIKIAQLRAGNTNNADKASSRIKPEYVVEDGDVLFSWSGSLEVEVWTGGRGALNQHLFKVTSSKVPKWFYYFATRQYLADFRAIAASKATTMGHIQRKHLTDAKIAVPSPEAMENFDCTIAPLFEQMIKTSLQSKALAQLRDTLLPKLISGEVRIKDAERLAETA